MYIRFPGKNILNNLDCLFRIVALDRKPIQIFLRKRNSLLKIFACREFNHGYNFLSQPALEHFNLKCCSGKYKLLNMKRSKNPITICLSLWFWNKPQFLIKTYCIGVNTDSSSDLSCSICFQANHLLLLTIPLTKSLVLKYRVILYQGIKIHARMT